MFTTYNFVKRWTAIYLTWISSTSLSLSSMEPFSTAVATATAATTNQGYVVV